MLLVCSVDTPIHINRSHLLVSCCRLLCGLGLSRVGEGRSCPRQRPQRRRRQRDSHRLLCLTEAVRPQKAQSGYLAAEGGGDRAFWTDGQTRKRLQFSRAKFLSWKHNSNSKTSALTSVEAAHPSIIYALVGFGCGWGSVHDDNNNDDSSVTQATPLSAARTKIRRTHGARVVPRPWYYNTPR